MTINIDLAKRPVTTTLDTQRLTSALGAVISGVDLTAPLEPETARAIRQAVLEYGVIFFRDQNLSNAQIRDFMANFGTPVPEPFSAAQAEPVVQADMQPYKRGTALWHADVTCLEAPTELIALRAVALPPLGGDTCWACMYAAYDALSEPLRKMLDGLTAVHSASRVMSLIGAEAPPLKELAKAVHPVIRVHPETGRKALFVNALWTDYIVGLSPAESTCLLNFLLEHVKSQDFNLRWRWRADDIALWDNRSTQHYAVPDYQATRVMQKVVTAGERPYGPN